MHSPPSDNVQTSPFYSKSRLRELARSNLKRMTSEEHKFQSAQIVQKLADYLNQRLVNARRIATFSALPLEPDLSLLISLFPNRQFLFPLVLDNEDMTFHLVTNETSLKPGNFGIREPNPQIHPPILAEDIDLVLVPGLSFDLNGNRIGQGKGYYDRFLKEIPTTPTIGICYSPQLTHQLPHEPHDRPMTFLATDCGIIPV